MPIGVYKRNLKPIIKAGDKYNKLTAIKFSHRDKWNNQYWFFKCDCGRKKIIRVSSVKNGSIKSCVYLRSIHKMINTGVYKSWTAMKARCLNKNRPNYKDYGGREITVCERWLKFENFYADMGNRPKGKSLDRKDNEKGYYKKNCCWSLPKEQANNRRNNHFLTYKNKTQNVSQWAEELNLNCNRIFQRLNRGWSIKRSLSPMRKYVYK